MEKFESQEKESKINYLDERLRVSFDIEPEAAKHLPEVSAEENETGKERFAVLLGLVERTDAGGVRFDIKGVYEEIEENRALGRGTYIEGREQVEMNVPALKQQIVTLRASNPEYKGFNFIGHIHTHPGLPPNENLIALQPSKGDIAAFASCYETGEMRHDEPFIFAIAAPDHDGATQYAFYRLIRDQEGHFSYQHIHLKGTE